MDYVLLFCLIGYPIAQYVAIRNTECGWRLLFALPAFPMVLVAGYTAIAFADGANLWPIVLVFTASVAALYLLVMALIYGVVGLFEGRANRRGGGAALQTRRA
jgi:hypothetical protein